MAQTDRASWRLPWSDIKRFSEAVAMGSSATQAYLKIKPNATTATARVNGPLMTHNPRVQMVIAAAREALIEKATDEFILNRDEVMRYHTLAALTPVGDVDERSMLAQEVTYRTTTTKSGDVTESKTIRMVGKIEALKELSKIRGDYKPEKLEITDTTKRDDALQRLADDPLFAELMAQQVPIVERAIEAREITEPGPPRRTLEEIEEAQQLDDEYLATL